MAARHSNWCCRRGYMMNNKMGGLIVRFLLLAYLIFFGAYAFSEEPPFMPETPSESETLEEMLKDETIPPEVREEIEKAVKEGAPSQPSGEMEPPYEDPAIP